MTSQSMRRIEATQSPAARNRWCSPLQHSWKRPGLVMLESVWLRGSTLKMTGENPKDLPLPQKESKMNMNTMQDNTRHLPISFCV